jgi:hypothetical protein
LFIFIENKLKIKLVYLILKSLVANIDFINYCKNFKFFLNVRQIKAYSRVCSKENSARQTGRTNQRKYFTLIFRAL